ncbi:hypothetical protein QAD02_014440 [Eretmocerus hayati]|uniref:Uncharacterized protein n=1 Tax=Eretmocerus hayati TaxID=131215 RepID=A0ACC2P5A2_9HYME|nr:hypothetical protein QAD02_014440 [Eretmocerus hayati]
MADDASSKKKSEIIVEFESDTESVSLPIIDLTITRDSLSAYFEGTVERLNYTNASGKNAGVCIDGDVFRLRPDVFKYRVKCYESAPPTQRPTTLNSKKLNTIQEFREIYLGQAKAKTLANQLQKGSTRSKIKALKILPPQNEQETPVQLVATSQKSHTQMQVKMGALVEKSVEEKEKIRLLNFGWMHRSSDTGKFVVQPAPSGGEKYISFNWNRDYTKEEVKVKAIKAFLTSETKNYFNNAIVELGTNKTSVIENFDDNGGFKGFVAAVNKKNHRFKLYVKTSFFPDYTDADTNYVQNGIDPEMSKESYLDENSRDSFAPCDIDSGIVAQQQVMRPVENLSNLSDFDLKAAILAASVVDDSSSKVEVPTGLQNEGNIRIETVSPQKKRLPSPTKIFKVPDVPSKKPRLADLCDIQLRPVHEFERSDFKLTTLLGCGTFGEVRKGWWDHTEVAVKILKVNKSTITAVKREVNILNQLSHPTLVSLYGVCIVAPKFHLIMEYVDGDNLFSILFDSDIGNDYNLELDSIAHQITAVLAYLHKCSCVHRDIKPGNILITKSGDKAKLCDLGLAKIKSTLTKDPYSTSKGKEIRQIGTPAYMAPEVFLKQKEADEPSDIWSLGCTLVELYSKNHVWDLDVDDSDKELEFNIFGKNLVPNQSCIPDFLKESLNKCFTYVASERITAKELLECFSFLIQVRCFRVLLLLYNLERSQLSRVSRWGN